MPAASSPPDAGAMPHSSAPRAFGFLSADQERVLVPRHGGRHAEVQVLDAQVIGEALDRPEVFVRHLGRGEDADLRGRIAPEPGDDLLERAIPRHVRALRAHAMLGLTEPALVVDPGETVAARIADPPRVDLGVETRLEAGDPPALVVVGTMLVGVHLDVAAARAAVANALGRVQVPYPHLEAEVTVGEGAHRTDVDHVARVLVVESLAGEEADLGVIAPVEDAELAGVGHLVAVADAARAQDAALGVED